VARGVEQAFRPDKALVFPILFSSNAGAAKVETLADVAEKRSA
jgi:hypothetical protein